MSVPGLLPGLIVAPELTVTAPTEPVPERMPPLRATVLVPSEPFTFSSPPLTVAAPLPVCEPLI